MTHLTAEHLHEIMPNAPDGDIEKELPHILHVMREYQINTKLRCAAFLANVAKESGQLHYVEELADGSDYEWRQDLGNTQAGDGMRFKGHGYIQITGRHNHGVVGKALGVDAISDPKILARMPYAWLSAGYYWRYMSAWGDLNEYADKGDFESTVLGVRGGPDPERRWYYEKALEVLPDDLTLPDDEEDTVIESTEAPQREAAVNHQGWIYDVQSRSWLRIPGLENGELATDKDGWLYSKTVWTPPATAAVEDGDLATRISRVTQYFYALIEAQATYFWWYEGLRLDSDGPPAFAVDSPAPEPHLIQQVFCAGLGNLALRLVGKPVPKNYGDRGYDGGTKAWMDIYGGVMQWFDLANAEEGDVAFRPFQYSGYGDQGHWAYVGPDGICMQSFAYSGATLEPGVNADYTLEQSHDGGYYTYLLKAEHWLL